MLNVLKGLGAVLLSVIVGWFVGRYITSVTLPPYTGGDALHSPNLDKFLVIMIGSFFGAVKGLLSAIITLFLVKSGVFPKLKTWQMLVLILAYGLMNSILWAAFAYHVAVEGGDVLHDFSRKMILETAITELITGCLIGGISVLLVKVFTTPSVPENSIRK